MGAAPKLNSSLVISLPDAAHNDWHTWNTTSLPGFLLGALLIFQLIYRTPSAPTTTLAGRAVLCGAIDRSLSPGFALASYERYPVCTTLPLLRAR